MMSEQAIETDESEDFKIVDEAEEVEEVEEESTAELAEEEPETIEAEAEEDDDSEVEVVFEGEDEPSSKPVRGVRRLVKRLGDAKAETDEERRKREALEEENKLLRMKLQQNVSEAEPNPDNFDTDAEYQSALKDYYRREARKAAAEETSRLIAETQQQTTQAQRASARSQQLDEHYKRVDSSGIKDYDELEGAAIDVLGQDFVEEIAANNDKGHLVIAHLGVNVGKAEKFARLAKTNPVRALLEIGALASELKVKRKSSRPASPEVKIDKGLARQGDTDDLGIRYY